MIVLEGERAKELLSDLAAFVNEKRLTDVPFVVRVTPLSDGGLARASYGQGRNGRLEICPPEVGFSDDRWLSEILFQYQRHVDVQKSRSVNELFEEYRKSLAN